MANGDDLETVQHETLGALKFPRDMPAAERQEAIDRVIRQNHGLPEGTDLHAKEVPSGVDRDRYINAAYEASGEMKGAAAPTSARNVFAKPEGKTASEQAGEAVKRGWRALITPPPPRLAAQGPPRETMSAQPTFWQGVENLVGQGPGQMESRAPAYENMTPEGRAEHPILSRVGDVTRGAKEYGGMLLNLGGLLAGPEYEEFPNAAPRPAARAPGSQMPAVPRTTLRDIGNVLEQEMNRPPQPRVEARFDEAAHELFGQSYENLNAQQKQAVARRAVPAPTERGTIQPVERRAGPAGPPPAGRTEQRGMPWVQETFGRAAPGAESDIDLELRAPPAPGTIEPVGTAPPPPKPAAAPQGGRVVRGGKVVPEAGAPPPGPGFTRETKGGAEWAVDPTGKYRISVTPQMSEADIGAKLNEQIKAQQALQARLKQPPPQPGTPERPPPTAAAEEADPLKREFPDAGVRRFARANGPEFVRATESEPEARQAVHDLTNVEVRQAAINAGIDVGAKHVGQKIGLGPEQVSRQELIAEMLNRGIPARQIPDLAKPQTTEFSAGELKQGDTFVDDKGEPRRVVDIEDGKIKTADGTTRTYEGSIESQTDLNSPKAQLARGGKFIAHEAAGVHEDDLPRDAKVPDVRWQEQDLQDTAKMVDEKSIAKDYGPRKKGVPFSVYQSYIPMEDMPTPRIVEEEEEDPELRNFGWREDYVPFRSSPPIKVRITPEGKLEILDGAHRTALWEDMNMTHAPAWVVDERGSGIENLAEEEKGERGFAPGTEIRYAGEKPEHMEEFFTAVQNTPGAAMNRDGSITLDLGRRQLHEQIGQRAIRSGVFFSPEANSPFGRGYTGRTGYGGPMRITEEQVTFRKPIVAKGATGGKVPERVYDELKGKGAYQEMRQDVIDRVVGWQLTPEQKIQRVGDVLERYGSRRDFADDIVRHSRLSNQLPYAVQEHIVAQAVRDAGYDAAVGYSKTKGQWRLSEVFDVKRQAYPTGSTRASREPWDLGKQNDVPSEEGYVYHATNADRLQEIADSGSLKTHRPDYGTEQDRWPDGSSDKRSYFTRRADHAWQFAPEEGRGVIVRMKENPKFHSVESTGDVYATQTINSRHLEYLDASGTWRPVQDLRGAK
jgi:hypothetical protein